MAFSVTATQEILGKVLCAHCGESVMIDYGSYHRNEDDEHYCECEGAKKEKEIRQKQAELRSQVQRLDYEARDLIGKSKDVLQEKMYKIELENLNRRYKKVQK